MGRWGQRGTRSGAASAGVARLCTHSLTQLTPSWTFDPVIKIPVLIRLSPYLQRTAPLLRRSDATHESECPSVRNGCMFLQRLFDVFSLRLFCSVSPSNPYLVDQEMGYLIKMTTNYSVPSIPYFVVRP